MSHVQNLKSLIDDQENELVLILLPPVVAVLKDTEKFLCITLEDIELLKKELSELARWIDNAGSDILVDATDRVIHLEKRANTLRNSLYS